MPRKDNRKFLSPFIRRDGFTLIEILVVLVAFAILAALAVPGWSEAVKRIKRAEGRSALMQSMQQQERYYSSHTTYIEFAFGASGADEKRFQWHSSDNAKSSAYELSATACAGDTIQNCIKISARPGTPRVDANFRDEVCGTLTLSSTGEKTPDDKRCW